MSRKFNYFTRTQSQPVWPTPKTPVWPKQSIKRRRLYDKPNAIALPSCGTSDIDLSDLSVPSIVNNANKFWLYLSKLNPLVTDGDVQKIVSRCLNAPESVEVIRLVPKGKNIDSLTFVSYKIGLDPDIKTKALDSSSWPTGLLFREFVDQPKNWDRQSACRTLEA